MFGNLVSNGFSFWDFAMRAIENTRLNNQERQRENRSKGQKQQHNENNIRKTSSHQKICQRPPKGLWKTPLCSVLLGSRRKGSVNRCCFSVNVCYSPRLLCFPNQWSPPCSLMFSGHSTFWLRKSWHTAILKDLQIALITEGGLLWSGERLITLWTNSTYRLAPKVSAFIWLYLFRLHQQFSAVVNGHSCVTDYLKPKKAGQTQERKGKKSKYHQLKEAYPSLSRSSIPLTVRFLKLSTPFWEGGIFPCKSIPSSDPFPT